MSGPISKDREVGDPAASTLAADARNLGVEETLPDSPPDRDRAASSGPAHGGAFAILEPNRYVIERELARGGMGRISIALDQRLGRTVAIKEVLATTPELAARFERELALTARLQHPNIVTIHDGGLWPDGRLVYVMRLVSGESLEQRIARCHTLDERIALVPHAIAAVDALAYAHARGVIHRDIKPANIMVGDFGETVVIDWGLAKDLTGADAQAPSMPSGHGGESATMVGDVVGTPAYMPPEQARGERVDERADVYALGAMLFHILSGTPPYRGRSHEVLAAVIDAPPRSLATCAPEVPRDLIAIVEHAMASQAELRYASASELGAELKRFQRGQLVAAHHYTTWELARRWIRRRRAPLAVATAGLVALAIGGGISVRRIVHEEQVARAARALAEANGVEAERRRQESERLVDFMVFELYEQLEPIGRLDVLGKVGEVVRQYYGAQPVSGDADDRRKRARARRHLGDVLFRKGDTTAALAEQDAAVASLRALAAGATDADSKNAAELVASYRARAATHAARGETPDAIRDLDDARTITERLVAASPKDPERVRLVNEVSIQRAAVDEGRGELAAARAGLEHALALEITLPKDDARDRRESALHDRLSAVLDLQGDGAASLRESRTALDLDLAQFTRHRDDRIVEYDLAVGYVNVGEMFEKRGDSATARTYYSPALEHLRALTAHDPDNPSWLRSLAVAHTHLGDVQLELTVAPSPRVAQAALAEFRLALGIRDRLAALDPSNQEWQRDLMVSQQRVGEMLEVSEQSAAAATAYGLAVAIGEQLERASHATVAQRDLVYLYDCMGRVSLDRHDGASALRWHRKELALAEQVIARGRTDEIPRDRHALEMAHEMIGGALASQRDLEGADASYARALDIAEHEAEAAPADEQWARTVTRVRALRVDCCASVKH